MRREVTRDFPGCFLQFSGSTGVKVLSALFILVRKEVMRESVVDRLVSGIV